MKLTKLAQPPLRLIPLQEQEDDQYRELVESLNVGVFRVTAEDMIFIRINPATAHIFGYDSVEEFMKTSMYDHYKYPEEMDILIDRLRNEGEWKNLEIEMLKRDGTLIWVSFNATVKYQERYDIELSDNPDTTDIRYISKVRTIKWIDGVLEDITERKEAVDKLKRLNKAYERFVPQEFLKALGKKSIEDVELNDRIQKKMTILFSDIRLFSTLSESMTPEENFKFINSYLSHMGPLVRQHHGFIDKFIGDSIMAIFGRDADDAVAAGIEMLKSLKYYNEGRQRAGYPTIKIGIGINTGMLMMGTIGEADRMEGTVISDAVNAASRLEQLTKRYNTPLLISEHTFHSLKNPSQFAIRFIDRVLVKGRNEPIAIYEVFNADPPELFESKISNRIEFETAMYHFRYHDMDHAKQMLNTLSKTSPEDCVAKKYTLDSENSDGTIFSPWREKGEQLKDNLICDIPIIDDEHTQMFSLTELLIENIKQNSSRETIIAVLVELNKKAVQHFKTEEYMMYQADYPGVKRHIILHKEFLTNSEYISEMISKTDYAQKSEALHLLLRIETLFVEWLANHEISTDKHFIAFIMGII